MSLTNKDVFHFPACPFQPPWPSPNGSGGWQVITSLRPAERPCLPAENTKWAIYNFFFPSPHPKTRTGLIWWCSVPKRYLRSCLLSTSTKSGPVTLAREGEPTVHGPDNVEARGYKVPVVSSSVAELWRATGALDKLHF